MLSSATYNEAGASRATAILDPLPLFSPLLVQRLNVLSSATDNEAGASRATTILNPLPLFSPLLVQHLNVLSSAIDNEAGAERATANLNPLLLFCPFTYPVPERVILRDLQRGGRLSSHSYPKPFAPLFPLYLSSA